MLSLKIKIISYVYYSFRVEQFITQDKWQKYYNDHLPLAISIECQRNFLVPNLLEKSLMRSTMANMMQHNEDVGPLLYGKETP